jgi:hypothetical protein
MLKILGTFFGGGWWGVGWKTTNGWFVENLNELVPLSLKGDGKCHFSMIRELTHSSHNFAFDQCLNI